MSKLTILWCTCWYDESIETIETFISKSKQLLLKSDIKSKIVIFDAKIKRNYDELKRIKSNCHIIKNNIDAFPNKNYGVYLLSEYSILTESEFIAIVDPDWELNDIESFITAILNNKNDFVIPNIGSSSGRSNLIIGRTFLELLYPDEHSRIMSPFPGIYGGKSKVIYNATHTSNYHFDWGGEWDILNYACKHHLKIESPLINIESTKHRSVDSKMHDSCQLWKAFFEGLTSYQYYNLLGMTKSFDANSELFKIFQNNSVVGILEQLEFLESKDNLTSSVLQLAFMILFPLGYIFMPKNNFKLFETELKKKLDNCGCLYDENLDKISVLSSTCVINILQYFQYSFEDIKCLVSKVSGTYFGDWNSKKD